MKRKFITLFLFLLLAVPMFAKTQKVVKYNVSTGSGSVQSTIDVTPQIQSMVNQGWYVVNITPVLRKDYNSNPTDYVIVVFEKE